MVFSLESTARYVAGEWKLRRMFQHVSLQHFFAITRVTAQWTMRIPFYNLFDTVMHSFYVVFQIVFKSRSCFTNEALVRLFSGVTKHMTTEGPTSLERFRAKRTVQLNILCLKGTSEFFTEFNFDNLAQCSLEGMTILIFHTPCACGM